MYESKVVSCKKKTAFVPMDELKTTKIIAYTTAAMLAVSIAWLVATWQSKAQMRFALTHERLRSEALLAEKLSIEKTVEETLAALRLAEDSIAQLARQIELLTKLKGNGSKTYVDGGRTLLQFDRMKLRQVELEHQLAKAYQEERRLGQENEKLLDSLHTAHGRNGKWMRILEMELIGLHE